MIFSWLASVLAAGGLVSLLLVSSAALGMRFHRMIGLLSVFLLAVGVAGGALRGGWGWSALLACATSVLLAPWLGPAGLRAALALGAVLAIAAVVRGTPFLPRRPVMAAPAWTITGNSIAAGLLLGSVCLAMLVGHWYLNVPGLPLLHLRRMTGFLALCLLLRGILGAASIAISSPTGYDVETSPWTLAGVREAFLFWQRVGIGLVAPAVLVFMVARTARIGSTQSATGLLYIMVVFVLIGEMMSRFLYLTAGIPQ